MLTKGEITDRLKMFFLEHPEFSHARRQSYLQAFAAFARFAKDPFSMSRLEFLSAASALEKDYKPLTWNGYVAAVRCYYKHAVGDGEYPETVKKVRLKRVSRTEYIKTKILTQDEIESLIRAASHPRDRALIAFMAGTGCRLGEAAHMRIADLKAIGNVGFEATLTGKTGTYISVPVVGGYAALLRQWLNHHPFRALPEAPLWVRLKDNQPLSPNRVYTIIKALAKRSGIRRNVHPHMLRHTQASQDAKNKIPMSTRKRRHGWSENSNMPNIYEHLSDAEGQDAYFEAFGVAAQKVEKPKFALVKCLGCGEENANADKYCSKCGLVLDSEEARLMLEREKLLEILDRMLHDPEIMKKLKDKL